MKPVEARHRAGEVQRKMLMKGGALLVKSPSERAYQAARREVEALRKLRDMVELGKAVPVSRAEELRAALEQAVQAAANLQALEHGLELQEGKEPRPS